MAKGSAIARRWAQALFEAAAAQGATVEVGRDLRALLESLWGSEEARRFLLGDRTSIEDRKKLVRGLLDAAGGGPRLVRSFVLLALDKRREAYLPDMAEAYGALLDRSQGLVEVEVRTAVELPAADRDGLRNVIASKLDRKIRTNFVVDSSLLGGLQIRVDDRLFDASLKRRLERLGEQLANARVGV